MWAATGLNGEDTRGGQGTVLNEKLLILAGEYVIRDSGWSLRFSVDTNI